MQYLLALGILVVIISFLIRILPFLAAVAGAGGAIYLAYRAIRYMRMKRYFSSEPFQARKTQIAAVVAEHNDIANYVAEIGSAEGLVVT
ncbi:hypothetical protein TSST111916_19080 [Tsukamurella strandjordii]|uniref:hypothetical protein n=1 Tax=Tsukamurella TaxID=2060 RepID=UPI001C7E0F80|nr:hypothetical protein [Tsukamurella sp. TY48]GIZ97507.1 hypothetical protein TTY48_21190 [Tsukamurella sp. TY48]